MQVANLSSQLETNYQKFNFFKSLDKQNKGIIIKFTY